jgi:hypothetical protein
MSPVEIWGIPHFWATSFAKVPFPAPGGPKKINFILTPYKIKRKILTTNLTNATNGFY